MLMKTKISAKETDKTARAAGKHVLPVRVYYEDTDAAGVVYYANYLGFAERGRTELLRELGANHHDLKANHNLLFAVKKLVVDYQSPARLDDLIEVETEVTACGAATLDMRQIIRHEGKPLAVMAVTLVTISTEGKVLRMPKEWRAVLRARCI